jgi:hypothetical protein
VNFVNKVYSKKLNVLLTFNLNDCYFSKEAVMCPDNITILNSSQVLLNIYISDAGYLMSSNSLTNGNFHLLINFYNYSNNLQFTVDKYINISKNQNIILSDGGSIILTNQTLFVNTFYEHSFGIYLNKTNPVYFGSLLNFSVGDYSFAGPVRYW